MKNDVNIILASASPRRKEILSKAGFNFEVIPSNYDEKISDKIFSEELINNCALEKALDVQKRTNSNCLIIGADTVVVSNNIILGKPKDKNDAFRMLKSLSDKTHFVISAICLLHQDKKLVQNEVTKVTFRKLEDSEIINYINSKNPLDKAGSYGIQDEGFNFATLIEGELDNVIGFSMKLFKNMLLSI